jgi:hypothetical protein
MVQDTNKIEVLLKNINRPVRVLGKLLIVIRWMDFLKRWVV